MSLILVTFRHFWQELALNSITFAPFSRGFYQKYRRNRRSFAEKCGIFLLKLTESAPSGFPCSDPKKLSKVPENTQFITFPLKLSKPDRNVQKQVTIPILNIPVRFYQFYSLFRTYFSARKLLTAQWLRK